MNKIKKYVSIIFALLQILISFSVNVYATETNKTNFEISKLQSSANSFITSVNLELQKESTDVISELNKTIEKYKILLKTADKTEKDKISSLITTTNNLINDFNEFNNFNTSTRGDFHIIYSAEVAAAIAAFNFLGYNLSAELLAHAKDNDIIDSFYIPVYGFLVTNSNIFSNIKNNNQTSGSGAFPNSGTQEEKDLYYSIHAFNYRKSNSGRVVIIEDRYDFAQGAMGSSLTGMVVNEMYKAQEAGVIVPFYTHITTNTNNPVQPQSQIVIVNNSSSRRLFYQNVVLGQSEYKDFIITFDTSGDRIFQTFGKLDTEIEIFNEQGTSLTYGIGDDNGHSTNSFIRYYCTAGTKYIVRVSFHFNTSSGEFFFTATPANSVVNTGSTSIDSYNDIWQISGYTGYTFNTWTNLNQTKLLTFTPPSNGKYTFEIISSYDTCMYVIDPRSFGVWNDSLNYNDDDGIGLNPQIVRELEAGVPYLIIYSALNIQNSSAIGDVSINIAKN